MPPTGWRDCLEVTCLARTKLTEEMVGQAIRLKADGLSNGDIICALGIHESTFYRWIGNPRGRLQRALCEGREQDVVEQGTFLEDFQFRFTRDKVEMTKRHMTPKEMRRYLDIRAKDGSSELEAYQGLMDVLRIYFLGRADLD